MADQARRDSPVSRAPPPTSRRPLEALLLLANEPVAEVDLAEALDVPTATVEDALAELVAFYDETGRGFELRRLGGGWRYYTREEHAELISSSAAQRCPGQAVAGGAGDAGRRSPTPNRSPGAGSRPSAA